MGVLTLLRYLFGSRTAILEIAANPWAAPLGFVFVLSAGLVREYDGADLVHEPGHALLPIPASLATSFLLFCLTFAVAYFKSDPDSAEPTHPTFWKGYWIFLGLFWLTAPLAWFYAIPYERFLSAEDATIANLCSLGLVALWRVVLMCRVVTVLMGFRAWQAVALVFVLGDFEAFFAGRLSPLPIIEVMGGMRYTGSQIILRNVSNQVMGWACVSFPLWLFMAILASKSARPVWRVLSFAGPLDAAVCWDLKALAACSVLAWFAVLPFTQPEQILRRRVEKLLWAGDLEAAVEEMSNHNQQDFPPYWDPPPWVAVEGRTERPYQVLEVLDVILQRATPGWVRDLYVGKFARYLYYPSMSELDAQLSIRLLEKLPEREAILREVEQNPEYGHSYLNYALEKERKKMGPERPK